MKTVLVVLATVASLLSILNSTNAQPEYLVYSISGSVQDVGPRFGLDEYADRGQKTITWTGQLLYDCNSGLGSIIWRSHWVDGFRYYELIDFEGALMRYNVEYETGGFHNVFSALSGVDPGTFPDANGMKVLFLTGIRAVYYPIGAVTQDAQLIRKYVSPTLSGHYLFLDDVSESVRLGRIDARYDVNASNYANSQLGDYNDDQFRDIADLVDYYLDIYRSYDYRPYGE